MYFNNKEDTNIDKEFNTKKELNIKEILNKYKLFIIIGFILLIILLIILFIPKKEKITYFLTLEGSTEITLYEDATYVEPGYTAFDNKNNNLTDKVTITNNLDASIPGDYTITYSIDTISETRTIHIIEKPTGATYIHLKGDDIIYLNIGDTYSEPGCVVIDTVDSNLTSKVIIKNNIDSSKAGIYEVTYTVTNSSNITTTAKRKVIVMDSEVSLTLDNTNYTNQDININIHINDNYFSYFLTQDNEKITSKDYSYKVSSNGTYKFTIYNTKGTSSTKEITVTNIDKEKPTGSCSGYIQDGKSYITVSATDNVGISKYISNDINTTSNVITLNNEVSTPTVTIYDKSGNSTSISCTLEKKTTYLEQITPKGTENITYQEETDTLKIWIEKTSKLYISHIWVKDAYNQLKVAVPSNFGKELLTSPDMLSEEISNKNYQNKLIIAVNGSGFVYGNWDTKFSKTISGWNKTSINPLILIDSEVKRDYSYNIPSTNKYETYGLKSNGYLAYYVYTNGKNIASNTEVSNQIKNDGVKYTFGFCPVLVENSQVSSLISTSTRNKFSANSSAIRQSICQIDKNNFILATSYENISLEKLAETLVSLNCVTAFNLDGGGSTSLLLKKQNSSDITIIKKSTRAIADILYFVE